MNMQTHSLLLSVAVVFLMVTVLLTSQPNITGFVPTTTHSQELDIIAGESRRYALSASEGNLKLSSFSVSGTVEGLGLVNIYLTDGKTSLLVYSNKKKSRSSLSQITGLVPADIVISPGENLERTDELPAGYETEQGTFSSVCIDTCVPRSELYDKPTLYLDVVVDQAVVHITEITFSILHE